MRKEQLETDIFSIIGDSYQSISTAFIRGDEVLLVDALASRRDAEELRDFIKTELKKDVRFIILTHYMCDHMAALKSFPKAEIIAHQNYRRTFDLQRSISEEEANFFVEPTIVFSDKIIIKWGHLTLLGGAFVSDAVFALSLQVIGKHPKAFAALTGLPFPFASDHCP